MAALRSFFNDDGPLSPALTPVPNERFELTLSPHLPEPNLIAEQVEWTNGSRPGEGSIPPQDFLVVMLKAESVAASADLLKLEGTIDPVLVVREHPDVPYRRPAVERVGSDDLSYPRTLSLPSGDLEAAAPALNSGERRTPVPPWFAADAYEFDVTGSDDTSTHVDTIPREQTGQKRKRSPPLEDASTSRAQPASHVDQLSTLPPDVFDKWNRIAGPEALARLWHCLGAKRNSSLNERKSEAISEPSSPSETSIEGLLTRYRMQKQHRVNVTSRTSLQFAEVPRRLYLADVANLYEQESAAAKKKKETGKKMRGSAPRKSVKDIFVELLLSELITEPINGPTGAKARFSQWLQHGKRWAKLIGRYGSGILLLIPLDLTDNM